MITIKSMSQLALAKGGKCLSKRYINARTKLQWVCTRGHIWWARPDNIKHSKWCPYCSGNAKLTIEEMHQMAQNNNGECLSKVYMNSQTKLKWKCRAGHTWKAKPNHIRSGHWCPVCAQTAKLTLAQMKKIAEERGGKCLGTEYVNSQTKLQWQCAEGHKWYAEPRQVKKGSWCPHCSTGIGERACRKYFERIFDTEFPKTRPPWLINERGKRMELDGYSEKLNLAFEYQGPQHYAHHPRFHANSSIGQRKKDDEFKRKLCEDHRVLLVEIPYTIRLIDLKDIIVKKCEQQNVAVLNKSASINRNSPDIYSTLGFAVLKKIAEGKGGICLSKKYLGAKTKLKWQCGNGHIWNAIPSSIKRGSWCPFCAGRARLKLGDMHTIASSKDGKCLSRRYLGYATKLKWMCGEGHKWKATPSSIRHGSWCPQCAGRARLTLEEMKKSAETRQGRCLSEKYVNAKTKLTWQCEKGHTWQTQPAHIKEGHWCPYCAAMKRAESRRLTIHDMWILAHKRNGECLSEEYVNNHSKLKWQCNKGHIWWAIPQNIKKGSWCPYCSSRLNARYATKEQKNR